MERSIFPMEKKVYDLLISEGLNQKTIGQRLGISKQRVSYLVGRLTKKGLISGGILHRKQKGGVVTPETPSTGTQGQHFQKKHLIRLHGQVFTARILNSSPKYEGLKRKPTILFEGHKVQLLSGLVVIHSWPGLQFIGQTPEEAHDRSKSYWLPLFYRLEKYLNVLIFKAGSTQIREIKAGHYAEPDNGLALNLKERREAFHLVGGDGIEWLLADFSHGKVEIETLHPTLAMRDMMVLQPFFDDLRVNCPGMTFSLFKEGLKGVLGLSQPEPMPEPQESNLKPDYIG